MSYNSTPAEVTFPQQSLVLSGDRKQDPETREWEFTEVTFYLDYNFDDRSISIEVFDDVTRTSLVGREYIKNSADALAIIEAIDVQYPGKIKVAKLKKTFKLFFEVGVGAVAIDTPVTDTDYTCDQCGDYNVDTMKFLYVPGVKGTDFEEGSIELHWEYGCYGGLKVEGTYSDKADEAIEILNRAINAASKKSYKRKLREAVTALSA